jgi:hypothetical protein
MQTPSGLAPSGTATCSTVAPLLDTFADGELSSDLTLSVQQHVSECAHCRSVVDAIYELKDHLKAAVHEDATVSPEFLARIEGALTAEQARIDKDQRIVRMGAQLGPLSWRTVTPLVAAACTLFWVGMKRPAATSENTDTTARPTSTADVLPLDEVLDELIDYHSAPPAPQLTEAKLIPQLEREVGVKVRLPTFDEPQWANDTQSARLGLPQWQGASVVPVRNHRAAYMRYNVGGHWVTLYVYNSGRYPIHQKLQQRVVHDLPVYVGERRGYSIAARERTGIGYAVATDFDDVQSAELVASIR